MSSQRAAKEKPEMNAEMIKITDHSSMMDQLQDIYKRIADRAFDIFTQRDAEHGKDMDDWLMAERELLRPVPIEIKEEAKSILIRAGIPGFNAKDITVNIEPLRITISGKASNEEPKKSNKKDKQIILHSDMLIASEIFSMIDLSTECEPTKSTAQLKDGVLNIILHKAERTEKAKEISA